MSDLVIPVCEKCNKSHRACLPTRADFCEWQAILCPACFRRASKVLRDLPVLVDWSTLRAMLTRWGQSGGEEIITSQAQTWVAGVIWDILIAESEIHETMTAWLDEEDHLTDKERALAENKS